MNPKSQKPVRLFVNPFTVWSEFALKAGQAMWASAHAAAVRANRGPKVAVIPTADPARNEQAPNAAVPAPRASKVLRKATRSTRPGAGRKANAKRRRRS